MVKSFFNEIVKLAKSKIVRKTLEQILRRNKKTLAKERAVTPHKGVLTGGQQRFTRSKKEIDKALDEAQGAAVHGVTYSHKRVDYVPGAKKFRYKKKSKKDVLDEVLDANMKTANINADGKSNKNINSSTKPAKVPLIKGSPAKQESNKIKTLKPPKAKMPKISWFKGADDPSKKPAPKPEVVVDKTEDIRDIMKRYPPAPSGPNVTEDERMDFLMNQK